MKRRRLWFSGAILAGFFLAVAAALAYLVKTPPAFYAATAMPAGEDRVAMSKELLATFSHIRFSLGSDPEWKLAVSADQINAFFQEDYIHAGADANLPPGFHDPRVQIDGGRLRLAVRYGEGLRSTVLSLELRAWVVPDEINLVAVEVISLKAGQLPLSTSTLLDYITAMARKENTDISWYRHRGHPVAVLRFQADQSQPSFQFERVELKDQELLIEGRSTESVLSEAPRTPPKP